MNLKNYHKKRDFKHTPEPYGVKTTRKSGQLYLIQKHAATHLHYDLRLELEGVLKSWAIPKGPSLDPTVKRLAVHVEDHPIEYGSFEGTIPKGEYGGGTVMLWDQGTWSYLDETQDYYNGDFTFRLQGKKLAGLWKLVQIKKNPKNWLLIKINDSEARPKTDFDITKAQPDSVVSQRTLKEIAENSTAEWTDQGLKPKPKTTKISKKTISLNLANLTNAKKQSMPPALKPQLATLVDQPPPGDNWLFEIKYDGYRLVSFIKAKTIQLFTRNNNDWTAMFPQIHQALKKLKLPAAILDGEIVALDENNHPNFQLLQNALSKKEAAKLHYYLFDIIYFDGFDLREIPLLERKQLLQNILEKYNHSDSIHYSDHIHDQGQVVFQQACELGLEGVIAKEIHSPYLQKRSRNWLKIKCVKRQEFVVAGFTKPRKSRKYFGSLLVGFYDENEKLHYCGHVGTGFSEASLATMAHLLEKYRTNVMPFIHMPISTKQITWVKPKIVVEIEFSDWTTDNLLRHPAFKGIRTDKKPKDIHRELPHPVASVESQEKNSIKKPKATPKKTKNLEYIFTNPDRILYPEQQITKRELAEFYHAISDWILPHISNRPLSLVRCPKGRGYQCFYQKHIKEKAPQGLLSVPIQEKDKIEDYIYIKSYQGLMGLVQLGVLEIHPWGSTINNIEKPDRIIFDLDPAPEVPWKKVVNAALFIRDQLEQMELTSFVKTSGGKGLHLVIPVRRKFAWEDIKAISNAMANYFVYLNPADFVATMTKSKRSGKIFIDYFRNNRGATTVAAYSTRARKDAPVSTPLAWNELTPKITSTYYTVHNLPKRLKQLKQDPWEGFFSLQQSLTKAIKFLAEL